MGTLRPLSNSFNKIVIIPNPRGGCEVNVDLSSLSSGKKLESQIEDMMAVSKALQGLDVNFMREGVHVVVNDTSIIDEVAKKFEYDRGVIAKSQSGLELT